MLDSKITQALAIQYPYACWVVEPKFRYKFNPVKEWEIRSSPIAEMKFGRYAIYVSKKQLSIAAREDIKSRILELQESKKIDYIRANQLIDSGYLNSDSYHLHGYVIGSVDIFAWVALDKTLFGITANKHYSPESFYKEGKCFAWRLRSPVKYSEPIKIGWTPGAVKFCNLTESEIEQVNAAEKASRGANNVF